MKKKMKESLYNYHCHFYNYWYFHFIAIMLKLSWPCEFWFPPCFCPRVAQWHSHPSETVCHSSAKHQDERPWRKKLAARFRSTLPRGESPTFHSRKKIKTLICQKAGRRKTIDEIVHKSRFNIAPSQTSDSLWIKANECRKHMLLVLPRGLL